MSQHITLAEIQEAAALLDGVTWRTTVEESTTLSDHAGTRVLLKCENLQRTGSFKLRGAYLRLSRLSAAERERGVVAASAGNHAQGVAFAAQRLGVPALVYMPENVALPKLAATESYGARVRLHGATVGESIDEAQRKAAHSGLTFIPPFDHPDVVTGQATIALEILEQVPDVGTIVVPTGGGGLLAGIASAVAATGREVDVVGVQAAGAAAFPGSLDAGRPVALTSVTTMADGIAVPSPSDLTLDIVRQTGARVETVSEEQLARAILLLSERAKLVVEPSGAAGVALLMTRPRGWRGPVVVVLSGGNVDTLVFDRVLRHGLVSAGRYLQLQVTIADQPGALAGLLAVLAETGGNVVSIRHDRTLWELRVSEVLVSVELETKGVEHCAAVVRTLEGQGYGVEAQSVPTF